MVVALLPLSKVSLCTAAAVLGLHCIVPPQAFEPCVT